MRQPAGMSIFVGAAVRGAAVRAGATRGTGVGFCSFSSSYIYACPHVHTDACTCVYARLHLLDLLVLLLGVAATVASVAAGALASEEVRRLELTADRCQVVVFEFLVSRWEVVACRLIITVQNQNVLEPMGSSPLYNS